MFMKSFFLRNREKIVYNGEKAVQTDNEKGEWNEIYFLECERASGLCTERVYRIFPEGRRGLLLSSGDKASGRTDRFCSGGVSLLLELCGEKRIFRHGNFYQVGALSVSYGIGIEEHDQEGRVITLEYPDFYMVTVYTPNSQNELARLDYRMKWEDDFRAYLKGLDEKKPVVMCGDLNVAHKEIDLKNPKTNRHNAGFTDEEREKFTELLEAGFTDTFRYFYPEETGIYSWWSYRFRAREKNAGWRIDYFCVSKRLEEKLISAGIHTDIFGSDHCPVEVQIDLKGE